MATALPSIGSLLAKKRVKSLVTKETRSHGQRPRSYRCPVRDRERNSRPATGRAARGSPNQSTAPAGIPTTMVPGELDQAVTQIRYRDRHSLRADPLECVGALL